jgi:hypothetical protein
MFSRLTDQLQSMHTEMIASFQSFEERFQVLEAKVVQVNINVETSLRHLVPKDQQD